MINKQYKSKDAQVVRRKTIRPMAILVLAAFLVQDIGLAASDGLAQIIFSKASVAPVPLADDPSAIIVPPEFAAVRELHHGTNGRFLIHLQDAHANPGAQENSAGAMEVLTRAYGIPLAFVEGGDRDVTLDDIRKMTSPDNWKKLGRRLLYAGLISGHELLSLTSDLPLRLIGVEYAGLYMKNLQAYQDLVTRREEVHPYLRNIRVSVDRVKNRIYPKELLDYEEQKRRAESQDGDGARQSLFGLLDKAGVDVPARFPEMHRLRLLAEHEKTLHFQNAAEEQERLVLRIASRGKDGAVVPLGQGSQNGGDTEVERLGFLNRLFEAARQSGEGEGRYPELVKYREYLSRFAALDLMRLTEETEEAEVLAYDTLLAGNETAQKIRAIDRFVTLLDVGYGVRMSSEEFERFKNEKAAYEGPAWQAFLNGELAKLGYGEDLVPYKTSLEEGNQSLERFYDLVRRRDFVFMENINRVMTRDNAKTAFFVTGGYHTRHLVELMRKEGYGYAVLAPVVTSETDRKKYEEQLLAPLKTRPRETGGSQATRNTRSIQPSHTLDSARLLTPPGVERWRHALSSRRGGNGLTAAVRAAGILPAEVEAALVFSSGGRAPNSVPLRKTLSVAAQPRFVSAAGARSGNASIPPVARLAEQIVFSHDAQIEYLSPQDKKLLYDQFLTAFVADPIIQGVIQLAGVTDADSAIATAKTLIDEARKQNPNLTRYYLRSLDVARVALALYHIDIVTQYEKASPTLEERFMQSTRQAKTWLDRQEVSSKDREILLNIFFIKLVFSTDEPSQTKPVMRELIAGGLMDRLISRLVSEKIFTGATNGSLRSILSAQRGWSSKTLDTQALRALIDGQRSNLDEKDTEKHLGLLNRLFARIWHDAATTGWAQAFFETRTYPHIVESYFDIQDLVDLNPSAVQNRALTATQARSFDSIRRWIASDSRRAQLTQTDYDLGGADLSTAFYLTDSTAVHIRDALPFVAESDLTEAKIDGLKKHYFASKVYQGYADVPLLWAIGSARIPILWELEAMGVDFNHVQITRVDGSTEKYQIQFSWSYDGRPENAKDRRVVYEVVDFLPEGNSLRTRVVHSNPNAIYLQKANLTQVDHKTDAGVVISFKPAEQDDEVPRGYTRIPIRDLSRYQFAGTDLLPDDVLDYVNLDAGYILVRDDLFQPAELASDTEPTGARVGQKSLASRGSAAIKKLLATWLSLLSGMRMPKVGAEESLHATAEAVRDSMRHLGYDSIPGLRLNEKLRKYATPVSRADLPYPNGPVVAIHTGVPEFLDTLSYWASQGRTDGVNFVVVPVLNGLYFGKRQRGRVFVKQAVFFDRTGLLRSGVFKDVVSVDAAVTGEHLDYSVLSELERVGVPSLYSVAAGKLVQDKSALRAVLKNLGLNVPDEEVLSADLNFEALHTRIRAFMESHPPGDVVIKPADREQSVGIRLFSRAGLEEATRHADSLLRAGQKTLLLQERIRSEPWRNGSDESTDTVLRVTPIWKDGRLLLSEDQVWVRYRQDSGGAVQLPVSMAAGAEGMTLSRYFGINEYSDAERRDYLESLRLDLEKATLGVERKLQESKGPSVHMGLVGWDMIRDAEGRNFILEANIGPILKDGSVFLGAADLLADLAKKHKDGNPAITEERVGKPLPTYRDAFVLRSGSAAFFRAGYTQAAELLIRRALSHYEDSRSWVRLGRILAHRGQDSQAEGAFRRAIELAPDYAPAWRHLADHLEHSKRLSESGAAYLRAWELNPRDIAARRGYERNSSRDGADAPTGARVPAFVTAARVESMRRFEELVRLDGFARPYAEGDSVRAGILAALDAKMRGAHPAISRTYPQNRNVAELGRLLSVRARAIPWMRMSAIVSAVQHVAPHRAKADDFLISYRRPEENVYSETTGETIFHRAEEQYFAKEVLEGLSENLSAELVFRAFALAEDKWTEEEIQAIFSENYKGGKSLLDAEVQSLILRRVVPYGVDELLNRLITLQEFVSQKSFEVKMKIPADVVGGEAAELQARMSGYIRTPEAIAELRRLTDRVMAVGADGRYLREHVVAPIERGLVPYRNSPPEERVLFIGREWVTVARAEGYLYAKLRDIALDIERFIYEGNISKLAPAIDNFETLYFTAFDESNRPLGHEGEWLVEEMNRFTDHFNNMVTGLQRDLGATRNELDQVLQNIEALDPGTMTEDEIKNFDKIPQGKESRALIAVATNLRDQIKLEERYKEMLDGLVLLHEIASDAAEKWQKAYDDTKSDLIQRYISGRIQRSQEIRREYFHRIETHVNVARNMGKSGREGGAPSLGQAVEEWEGMRGAEPKPSAEYKESWVAEVIAWRLDLQAARTDIDAVARELGFQVEWEAGEADPAVGARVSPLILPENQSVVLGQNGRPVVIYASTCTACLLRSSGGDVGAAHLTLSMPSAARGEIASLGLEEAKRRHLDRVFAGAMPVEVENDPDWEHALVLRPKSRDRISKLMRDLGLVIDDADTWISHDDIEAYLRQRARAGAAPVVRQVDFGLTGLLQGIDVYADSDGLVFALLPSSSPAGQIHTGYDAFDLSAHDFDVPFQRVRGFRFVPTLLGKSSPSKGSGSRANQRRVAEERLEETLRRATRSNIPRHLLSLPHLVRLREQIDEMLHKIHGDHQNFGAVQSRTLETIRDELDGALSGNLSQTVRSYVVNARNHILDLIEMGEPPAKVEAGKDRKRRYKDKQREQKRARREAFDSDDDDSVGSRTAIAVVSFGEFLSTADNSTVSAFQENPAVLAQVPGRGGLDFAVYVPGTPDVAALVGFDGNDTFSVQGADGVELFFDIDVGGLRETVTASGITASELPATGSISFASAELGAASFDPADQESISGLIEDARQIRSRAYIDPAVKVAHVVSIGKLMSRIDSDKRSVFAAALAVLFERLRKYDGALFELEFGPEGESFGLVSDAVPPSVKRMVLDDIDTVNLEQLESIGAGGLFYDLGDDGVFVNVAAALIFNGTVARMDLSKSDAVLLSRIEQFLRRLTRDSSLEVHWPDLGLLQSVKASASARQSYRRMALRAVRAVADLYIQSFRLSVESTDWTA